MPAAGIVVEVQRIGDVVGGDPQRHLAEDGTAVTFKAVVRNAGSAATPSGVIHGVGFRVDGRTVTWSDTYVSSLAPGASVTLTANGGADGSATWTAEAGLHTVEAYVDDADRIVESNEDNNRRSTTLAVDPAPTTAT